jgi:hypothetical protein
MVSGKRAKQTASRSGKPVRRALEAARDFPATLARVSRGGDGQWLAAFHTRHTPWVIYLGTNQQLRCKGFLNCHQAIRLT